MTNCVIAAPIATAAMLSARSMRPAMAVSASMSRGTVTLERMFGRASAPILLRRRLEVATSDTLGMLLEDDEEDVPDGEL